MAGPAHDTSGDYHRGDQDISEQVSTWALFMSMSKWGSLLIAVVVSFFTIWLYPRGTLAGAAFVAIVLLAAGIWFLRKKPDSGH